MYGLASTTCSILRGTVTNGWGDEIDDPDGGTVVASGVLIALKVNTTTPYDPATQTIRTIRGIGGAVQSDIDVRESDRIRDEVTGVTYAVESVTADLSPGYAGDLELVLRLVT